jgi:AcrR family transcriptional regulator
MPGDTNKGVRDRILDAAVELLRHSGVKKLAQPQVAREAGVPQGHLTYYFPRKVDLLLAVGGAFVQMLRREAEAQQATGTDGVSPLGGASSFVETATAMVLDRSRTRMLVGLVTEADAEPAVAEPVMQGARYSRSQIAGALSLHPDDPDVWLTLAMVWGLGLQQMVMPDRDAAQVRALLERFEQWLESSREGEDGDLRRSGTVLRKQVG